jgi:hypothetical protein
MDNFYKKRGNKIRFFQFNFGLQIIPIQAPKTSYFLS